MNETMRIRHRNGCAEASPRIPPLRARRGFTLVELLVVVAIIALLMGLMMPSLQSVRETMRATQCSANFRLMGVGLHLWAADYHDRFIGWGRTKEDTMVDWYRQINEFHFKSGNNNYPVRRHVNGPNPPRLKRGTLFCPSYRAQNVNLWPRIYSYNQHAQGGPYSGVALGVLGGPLPSWMEYNRLGAPVSRFRLPAGQILMREVEFGSDSMRKVDFVNGNIAENMGTDGRPWTSGMSRNSAYGGHFAFRHRMRGAFLFVDGHVALIGPEGQINEAWQYDPTL